MPREFTEPAQFENSTDAEMALAVLEMNAELIEAYENETIGEFREGYARMFRDALGVPLERGDDYRRALECIRANGHEPVNAARQRFAHKNGSPIGD